MGESAEPRSALRGVVLGVAIVFCAIMLNPIVWRVCCYKPYSQPSGSMEPALRIGDYWFASTWAYWGAGPSRGDIVAFRHPKQADTDYVKRIIGLPGETVQLRDGRVVINGTELGYAKAADFVELDSYGAARNIPQLVETLPEGRKVLILDRDPGSLADNTPLFAVPAGHYFMLGDNRDNSSDSRFDGPNDMGMVPAENIIGRAGLIYFSYDGEASGNREGGIRWERVLSFVR